MPSANTIMSDNGCVVFTVPNWGTAACRTGSKSLSPAGIWVTHCDLSPKTVEVPAVPTETKAISFPSNNWNPTSTQYPAKLSTPTSQRPSGNLRGAQILPSLLELSSFQDECPYPPTSTNRSPTFDRTQLDFTDRFDEPKSSSRSRAQAAESVVRTCAHNPSEQVERAIGRLNKTAYTGIAPNAMYESRRKKRKVAELDLKPDSYPQDQIRRRNITSPCLKLHGYNTRYNSDRNTTQSWSKVVQKRKAHTDSGPAHRSSTRCSSLPLPAVQAAISDGSETALNKSYLKEEEAGSMRERVRQFRRTR